MTRTRRRAVRNAGRRPGACSRGVGIRGRLLVVLLPQRLAERELGHDGHGTVGAAEVAALDVLALLGVEVGERVDGAGALGVLVDEPDLVALQDVLADRGAE